MLEEHVPRCKLPKTGSSCLSCTEHCTSYYWRPSSPRKPSLGVEHSVPDFQQRWGSQKPSEHQWLQRTLSTPKKPQPNNQPQQASPTQKFCVSKDNSNRPNENQSNTSLPWDEEALYSAGALNTSWLDSHISLSLLMPRQHLCNGINKTSYSWGTGSPADKGFFLWLLFEVFHLKFVLEVPSPDWPRRHYPVRHSLIIQNVSKQRSRQPLEFWAIITIISRTFKKHFLLSTPLSATVTFRTRYSIPTSNRYFTHCCRPTTCETNFSGFLRF